MKYSEGLVLINSKSSSACVEGRARQMRGAVGLIFIKSRSSSACVKGRARQLDEFCGEEPVCVKYSKGLVLINSRSSSACVEGRELINERSSWARLHE